MQTTTDIKFTEEEITMNVRGKISYDTVLMQVNGKFEGFWRFEFIITSQIREKVKYEFQVSLKNGEFELKIMNRNEIKRIF